GDGLVSGGEAEVAGDAAAAGGLAHRAHAECGEGGELDPVAEGGVLVAVRLDGDAVGGGAAGPGGGSAGGGEGAQVFGGGAYPCGNAAGGLGVGGGVGASVGGGAVMGAGALPR